MASWTAASRKAYKKSHPENFAGPGTSYPIKDGEDVKNAWNLAGHSSNPDSVRRKVRSIARRLGLTGALPKVAKADMSMLEGMSAEEWDYTDWYDDDVEEVDNVFDGTYSIASFAVSRSENGLIYRRGKVFEVGEYPDKDFTVTAEEMKAAIANFKPLPNRGAHVPTIFDGKMGMLESLELADDGKTVNGLIAIPRWLNELHGEDAPLQASLEFRRDTKEVIGNTLIPNPRVGDSALLAAFEATQREERSPATLLETIKALLGLSGNNEAVSFTPAKEESMGTPVTTPVTTPPATSDASTEITALREQVEGLKRENRQAQARSAVAGLSGWILPAQVPALTAVFEKAIAVDQQAGTTGSTVEFAAADGTTTKISFADALTTAIKAGPKQEVTKETAPAFFTLNGNQQQGEDTTNADAVKNIQDWAKKNGFAKTK